ncbi:hypothetical protein [Legionella bononiensis]|uniref:Uncharacterized protein n=1 Tax=Legionella bononiensis TaxID=2793102 RepID=A0ABS1W9T7_9GAMM|nr:hypothetical protein [Legionella bononiensis]MBL7480687.1 hypothetical protein [Legionella bononiensis]MBL7526114.1 hypothetical protein [Legionella bononiensis]MBL7563391.1 hypothetical protein [Legionella bononiensis]
MVFHAPNQKNAVLAIEGHQLIGISGVIYKEHTSVFAVLELLILLLCTLKLFWMNQLLDGSRSFNEDIIHWYLE